jgi:hypothetical protein
MTPEERAEIERFAAAVVEDVRRAVSEYVFNLGLRGPAFDIAVLEQMPPALDWVIARLRGDDETRH